MTLVVVSPSEYPLFKKETIIDCNRSFEKTAQSLIDKLERGKLRVCTELMSSGIVQKLVRGVLASMQTTEKVKKILSA